MNWVSARNGWPLAMQHAFVAALGSLAPSPGSPTSPRAVGHHKLLRLTLLGHNQPNLLNMGRVYQGGLTIPYIGRPAVYRTPSRKRRAVTGLACPHRAESPETGLVPQRATGGQARASAIAAAQRGACLVGAHVRQVRTNLHRDLTARRVTCRRRVTHAPPLAACLRP